MRNELFAWVKETYGIIPDYPWLDNNAVLRHKSNRKWFGVVLTVSADKLGLKSHRRIDVLNVKCESIMAGTLHNKNGFFPAYHMNKQNWVSVLLDGTVNFEDIKLLLDISYGLTKTK